MAFDFPDANVARQIERWLGRNLSPDDKGGIDSFLEFSPNEIQDVRTIGASNETFAALYIMYRMKGMVGPAIAKGFYVNVVLGGVPVAEWNNRAKEPTAAHLP